MGKRVPAAASAAANGGGATDHGQHVTPTTRSIRKRRRGGAGAAKSLRLSSVAIAAATAAAVEAASNNNWHENDDEDSSSNDTLPQTATSTPARNHQASSKHANHSSILLNASFNTSALNATAAAGDTSVNESPKPVYTLRPSVVNGTILYDLTQKPWRLGRPIGKGNFGEIFLASDNITIPVTNENAKFVVKIEPHSNGPLFVEIHCLINTAKKNPNKNDKMKTENESREDKKPLSPARIPPPSGIPDYIASGSHYFGDARYRFLVLQRFDRDLHSLIKNCRVNQKSVLTLAIQIVNVLERLHDKGYCHNDVKAQNLMISRCKYHKQKSTENAEKKTYKKVETSTTADIKEKHKQNTHEYEEKQQTTDSGNSSEQEEANDNDNDEDYAMPNKKERCDADEEDDDDNEDDDDDEDFDDGETTNSNNSNSMDLYKTPVKRINRKRDQRNAAASANATAANASGRRCAVAARASAPSVEYSGSNPVRSCRRQQRNSTYEEMVNSHYLRPTKRISYTEFFNEDGISVRAGGKEPSNNSVVLISSDDDDSEEFVPTSARRNRRSTRKSAVATTASSSSSSTSKSSRAAATRLTRHQEKLLASSAVKPAQLTKHPNNNRSNAATSDVPNPPIEWLEIEEERIFLIDFGLASKFMDNGVHRPFFMDQRRAHDGTLEFTSRDAHTGAHSRRSDLECLGYNLLFWSQGYLPWKEAATHQQQEKVHRAKEYLMTDVRELLQQIYGKQVPKYLGEFLHHVGQLAYHERPDYARYRRLFECEFQQIAGGGGVEIANEDVMRIDSRDIMRTCVRFKEEIENNKQNDLLSGGEHNHIWSIMKSLAVVGVGTPFHERTLSNRVSPKNLRSMSDKKSTIKKKKFSWAEILSQDPDQIARERAEKEFDREEESDVVQQPTVRRYEGKPTYAIMEIQRRLIASGRLLPPVEHKKEYLADVKEADEMEAEKEDDDIEMKKCDKAEQDNAEEADEDENDDEEDEDVSEVFEQDGEEEEEEENEDDEIETDATEVSEPQQKTKGRSKRSRQIAETTTTISKKSAASKTNSRSKRAGSGKRAGVTATATETATKSSRKRCSKTTTKASSSKRGSATRKSGGGAAAAAGEVEHANTKCLANAGGGEASEEHPQRPPRRRTRRCLIKTDKAEDAEVLDAEMQPNALSEEEGEDDDVIMMESEGSNSNFSPDVHSLFNVWKKINNETIYFRGSKVAATAARRHCKK